jgi:hypothetical protein
MAKKLIKTCHVTIEEVALVGSIPGQLAKAPFLAAFETQQPYAKENVEFKITSGKVAFGSCCSVNLKQMAVDGLGEIQIEIETKGIRHKDNPIRFSPDVIENSRNAQMLHSAIQGGVGACAPGGAMMPGACAGAGAGMGAGAGAGMYAGAGAGMYPGGCVPGEMGPMGGAMGPMGGAMGPMGGAMGPMGGAMGGPMSVGDAFGAGSQSSVGGSGGGAGFGFMGAPYGYGAGAAAGPSGYAGPGLSGPSGPSGPMAGMPGMSGIVPLDVIDRIEKYYDSKCIPPQYAYYCNGFANVVIQQISLLLAGKRCTPPSFGRYAEAFEELSVAYGKRPHERVGRYDDECKLWRASNRYSQKRIFRVSYWFCKYLTHVMPLIACKGTPMELEITFQDLKRCFVSSDTSTPFLIGENRELNNQDIDVRIYADVYHFPETERQRILEKRTPYLIEDVQLFQIPIPAINWNRPEPPVITQKLPFHHPVFELIWTVQDESHVGCRDWFNWSHGADGSDPIDRIWFTINGQPYGAPHDCSWYRKITPEKYHSAIPGRHVYCLPLSDEPERTDKCTGFINFSGLLEGPAPDKPVPVEFCVHMIPKRGLGNAVVEFWARSLNWFMVYQDKAGFGY